MKYKKYILFLLLTLVLGLNKIYASDCYYISDKFSARYNTVTHDVYVDKSGNNIHYTGDEESIENANEKILMPGGLLIPEYTNTNKCPNYLVMNHDTCDFWVLLYGCTDTYDVYALDDEDLASTAAKIFANSDSDVNGYYSPLQPNMTEEEYMRKRFTNPKIVDNDGENNSGSNNGDGKKDDEEEKLKCDLFGDKDDAGSYHMEDGKKVIDRPASIRYLVNQILTYVRVIIPIVILVLGSLDFAKAMVAGKEDEMKKAQKTFIMRLVAGVLVFMTPMIVNLIMSLAEIVWEGLGYSNCGL